MRKIYLLSALLIISMFVLPLLGGINEPLFNKEPDSLPAGIVLVTQEPGEASASPAVSPDSKGTGSPDYVKDADITVKCVIGGENREIKMNDYLFGVLAGEMPAAFPEEALKAQAIAARTFILNRMRLSEDSAVRKEHGGAFVCDNPNHCKAYMSPETAKENWGELSGEYTKKLEKAVSDTDGKAIYYKGEPILAVFHSSSSGKTENSGDVWGETLPYLVSVDSPGEDECPSHYGRVEVKAEDFKNSILSAYPEANLSGSPSTWFYDSVRSEAGGIITIHVGGVKLTGNQIRTMCSLRSTNFTVEYSDGLLIFKTVGYGHGVGMSQYGARAMALEGKSCEEILKWYYTGAEILPVTSY